MKKILIATPSYDGKLDVWYVNALWRTILLGLQNNVTFIPVFLSYDALIQRSRNDLVAIAKKEGFDGMLWIDSDIEWDPEWAFDIINYNEHVFGLPCIKKSFNEEYNVNVNIENVDTKSRIISVNSVGTGFLFLSKEAITYLWDNSKPYTHYGEEKRFVFEVGIKNGDLISEDVIMCQKLKEGGFDILIDTERTCNHTGALKYSGDFKDYLNRIDKISNPTKSKKSNKKKKKG